MMSHDELVNYYKINFALIKFHNYTLEDLENMLPWERDVYVSLLIRYIKEENERKKRELKSKG